MSASALLLLCSPLYSASSESAEVDKVLSQHPTDTNFLALCFFEMDRLQAADSMLLNGRMLSS